MLKKISIAFGILIFIAFILIFRPVPIVEEQYAIETKGIVTDIYEG